MRILLLNPPFKEGRFSRNSRSPAVTKSGTLYYPIWLAYAAGVLEKEGFDVKLLDCPARGISKEDAAAAAKGFDPQIVVIDTSTPSIYSDAETAGLVKDNTDNAFTILVGTHPSSLPAETLSLNEKIDAVAVGEYDYTIRDLAKSLDEGGTLESVSGMTFRDGEEIIHNEKRPFIEDLDELPFASAVYKSHLNIRDYFFAASLYPFVMIITGRGCPYQCSFCVYPQVFHSRRYRVRSAANVADEFEYVIRELEAVKEIGIEDDTFTVDKGRVREICELLIKRNLKITWYANARADLDFETMKLMRRAGCRLLIVGFESGSQKVLDNINKDIMVEEMARFNKDAKRAGLLIHGCFIFGNPGETPETLSETLNFALDLECDTAQFFPFMVYPGTEAYDRARQNGHINSGDFSKWVTEGGLHNTVLETGSLSSKELVEFCNYARRRFYLRPGYIFYKSLRSVTNPDEFTRTFRAFKTFSKHLF